MLNPYSNGMFSFKNCGVVGLQTTMGLNPYSNGMFSFKLWKNIWNTLKTCLNPYSNGMFSFNGKEFIISVFNQS